MMGFRLVITSLLLLLVACAVSEKTDVAEVPDSSMEDKQLESLISANDLVSLSGMVETPRPFHRAQSLP